MQDLRQIPRWKINQKAQYNISQTMTWHHCLLEDINLKGMRICLPQSLPLQNPVGISLLLEDGFALRIEGNPCWEKNENGQHSYGIAFTRVFDEDKDRIYHFIRKYCSEQFKDHWWSS